MTVAETLEGGAMQQHRQQQRLTLQSTGRSGAGGAAASGIAALCRLRGITAASPPAPPSGLPAPSS